MNNEKPRCVYCIHCGSDPDGLYCGEEHAMKNSSGYGRSPHVARTEDCGEEGIFYQRAPDVILKWRGLI